MSVVWVTLIAIILAVCQASPLPHRIKYDQRQEGKWNVRADLENFIILVIPTSTSPSGASNGSLLDFLSKTIPLPYYKKSKKRVKVHQQEDGSLPDTEHFIESKTAPYHVDISRTKNHLAKLHPEVNIPESVKEKIIIARSPSVALAKSQEGGDELRKSRAILISVPMENENIQRHSIKDVVGGKGDGEIKKTIGMSIDAIEKGLSLAAEAQKKPDGLQAFEIIPNKLDSVKDTTYADSIKKISEEVKTAHAVVLAKAVHVGLVEYFRKLAEKMKEVHEAEKLKEEQEEEEEESLPKSMVGLRSKVRKTILTVKDKRQEKEKGGFKEERDKVVKVNLKEENVPKVVLEPPKVIEENVSKEPTEASKENSKDQLLLLGALEQCGPGRERDPSGICTSVKS